MIKKEIERVVGEGCDGFSGADLAALVREAGVIALKRTLGALDDMDDDVEMSKSPKAVVDLLQALSKVGPSVSVAQRRRYENLRSKFAGLPVRIGKDEEDKRDDVQS
jgi:ribosome biogenesis ATPase